MDLIPAIDIIAGEAVRLSQGAYDSKKVYASDPLEIAKQFEDHQIKRLHLVDLDGAKGKGIENLRVLERIATHTSLVIDFGGGIKHTNDLKAAFGSGASMVTCGSIAAKDPDLVRSWIDLYGADRLILGADARDGLIRTNGWIEESSLEVGAFIDSYLAYGLTQVICTDIAKDGMLEGPSLALYQTLLETRPTLHLIASGGVSSIEDLRALRRAGLGGAIIGKAIYEGRISLQELQAFGEENYAGQTHHTLS
ncbi:1-(5-phosphoribosyl)-5-[(5-phosphoribosylamino)methylideneamino]imidazole-4-carboxamide isomerase [Sphaerochaeta sp.]|uniref:1-(5-phosphoribosyl)-5-[(5- phosphoribosylamino)methylideneamino]imidazole-4- carboxamide isomerase n=1 Tax=Sphaerochaeta sp. TaxID=1972642 RepID=UPI003D0ACF1B